MSLNEMIVVIQEGDTGQRGRRSKGVSPKGIWKTPTPGQGPAAEDALRQSPCDGSLHVSATLGRRVPRKALKRSVCECSREMSAFESLEGSKKVTFCSAGGHHPIHRRAGDVDVPASATAAVSSCAGTRHGRCWFSGLRARAKALVTNCPGSQAAQRRNDILLGLQLAHGQPWDFSAFRAP